MAKFARLADKLKNIFAGMAKLVYLFARIVLVYSIVFIESLLSGLAGLKQYTVGRMFWGRGSFYKNSFHVLAIAVTGSLLLTGIINRVGQVEGQSLEVIYGSFGNNDLLLQGSSITSVLAIDETEVNYKVVVHKVRNGESLDSIATEYGVSKDTIKWANDRILSPFNDSISTGWELKIPEMNGVLYRVQRNQSLDDIVALTKGDRFSIIELNSLVPPTYGLNEGQQLFIPDGKLAPPPPPIPRPSVVRNPGGGGYIGSGVTAQLPLGNLPLGTFDDPLTHPRCSGYGYSRGFSAWHTGVDLTKGGGCPIRAVAAGVVKRAGWIGGGAGYSVVIDHGEGVETHYYHGDGNIWVRSGQRVSKGQDIMYMGNTGNSTGTHLHLTLKYGARIIDPAPYIPYRR